MKVQVGAALLAAMLMAAGAQAAPRAAAEVGPGGVTVLGGGTPNDPYPERFASFPPVENVGGGLLSISAGGVVSSAGFNATFGRIGVEGTMVAAAQDPSTPSTERRFPGDGVRWAQPSYASFGSVTDYIHINSEAQGPLFASFRLRVDGDVSAMLPSGTRVQALASRVAVGVDGVYTDTNIFPILAVDRVILIQNGSEGQTTTDDITRTDLSGTSPLGSFGGVYEGRMPFLGGGRFNPFFFFGVCQSVSFGIGFETAASAACGVTVTWLGIDGVTDAAGNVVTDWTIESSSGFDYAGTFEAPIGGTPRRVPVQAFPVPGFVPEPAAWSMMIVGFGLAGAAARRRMPRAA